ncbi:conserved hypothetical protein (DUF547) [Formosa agariphila KMM 3901]|uniref:DUF547 domain-containing protein n=1 Tax=Formosa agariphila (strain DSM 15362 / KCTC 12365 / LMG 23005 / KMM 3901 / M-2Alg 35-1) TaxID=1347342 RepID=T2KI54_FORAG|nr:DUF547 domain-containing protein [Formosa agariphila]CDF78106.1 conserved hypothetical protein (DUF547) [Formosa agariphila KMM 3901]
MENSNRLLTISGALLLQVKLKKESRELEETLGMLSMAELYSELITDSEKNTFWINIYNAYFQILFSRDSTLGKAIFRNKDINIAQTYFSLDDIEHGILRRYRWKQSLGYFRNPFASRIVKKLAVSTIDYRIHFALNCGAKSCPPIAFYTLDALDEQLKEAMYSFLSSETSVNINTNTVHTSKLLFWYQGDFGGVKGVKAMLNTVLQIEINSYSLKYNSYSWEPHLENFV